MADGSSSNNATMSNDVSSSSNNNTFKLGWDPKFLCNSINGIHAPLSVSWISPSSVDDAPPQQEQAQEGSASASSRRSRRDLSLAAQDEVLSLKFRLLKCQNEDGGYILEMREVEKMHDYYYVLHPVEGKETVKVKEFRQKETVVKEVTEDVETPPDNKYKLSLQQRIQGKWRVEARKRKHDSAKIDKFYYHEGVNNVIRSFPDVAAFILYGVIPEISRKEKRKRGQVTAESDEMMTRPEEKINDTIASA